MKNLGSKYFSISIRDKFIMMIKSILVVLLLDYFFYKKIWMLIPLMIIGILYFFKLMKDKYKDCQQEFRLEFKELLLQTSNGQRAGFSIENSICSCYQDISRLFGKDSAISKMIIEIENARKNRKNIADVFKNIGMITGVEEVQEFGEVYEIAYEKSGNLASVMEKTAQSIVEKLELENEIFMELGERSFELKVMNGMPFLIMFYISLTNRGYFDPMYETPIGFIVMTICMSIYIVSYLWGNKIMAISV